MKIVYISFLFCCCFAYSNEQSLDATALQIISFNGQFYDISVDSIKTVIRAKDIGDRKVVAVSIAGEYRTGKSFILNFFLKYLYAQYKKHDLRDWLGEKSTDSKLNNGFRWRAGRNPETRGISMWSEIFTYDFDNGERVAIILIDTQGLFDSSTSVAQSTAIFALSTLLSSVQIYNVMRNIEESQLHNLDFYSQYGRTVGRQSNGHPFQRILFLVRDWQFDESYGLANGRRQINDTLFLRPEQTPDMRLLRQRLLSSFESIDAFLLPHPGSAVTKFNYDGNLQEVDQEFKNQVKDLAIEIFAPKNLLIKKINDEKVSTKDWLQFLESYVKIFNGTTLPKAENAVEATAKVNNMILYDRCLEEYVSNIAKTFYGNKVLADREIFGSHQVFKKKAMDSFKETTKFGGAELAIPLQNKLNEKIDAEFMIRSKDYSAKRVVIIAHKMAVERASRSTASTGPSAGGSIGVAIGYLIFSILKTLVGFSFGAISGVGTVSTTTGRRGV